MSVRGLPALVVAAIGMLAVFAMAGTACSGDDGGVSAPALSVTGQYATASTNGVSAVYFTIKNTGGADALRSVSTDASPAAMLHQTVEQGNSSSMKQLTSVPIPAHGELTFRPGDYHVMIMDLAKPLVAGSVIQVTLEFQRSAKLTFAAPVKPFQ